MVHPLHEEISAPARGMYEWSGLARRMLPQLNPMSPRPLPSPRADLPADADARLRIRAALPLSSLPAALLDVSSLACAGVAMVRVDARCCKLSATSRC